MLFPAHAGVIPLTVYFIMAAPTFPRPRGGDPTCPLLTVWVTAFSPPTRG